MPNNYRLGYFKITIQLLAGSYSIWLLTGVMLAELYITVSSEQNLPFLSVNGEIKNCNSVWNCHNSFSQLRHIKLPAINILRKNLKEIDLLGKNKEVHPVLTWSFSLPCARELITDEAEKKRKKKPTNLQTAQETLPGNKRKELLGISSYECHDVCTNRNTNWGRRLCRPSKSTSWGCKRLTLCYSSPIRLKAKWPSVIPH